MALKLDYVVRETSTNLRRNVTLTIAAIVTIGVSLSLFGSAMLIRGGIESLTVRWEDDVEIIVFLDRQITDEQRDALEASIEENPEVARYSYANEEMSREEYRRLFERSEPMIQWLEENPDGVPTSFRIVPHTVERSVIRALSQTFKQEAGVFEVTSSLEGVEAVERLSNSAQRAIFVIAVGLLIAALMLILNAIRVAMFARRREIEVMKLVGATNWFIRVPFMLEGVVHGLLGSIVAIGAVQLLDKFMAGVSQQDSDVSILHGFVAPTSTVFFVQVLVVALGMVIGAVGSGIAISRFLKI